MARHEQHREDVLREATALVQRVAWQTAETAAEPIVVGFRRDGSGSIYFGQDYVLQFNLRRELRRAFAAGEMVKAERGELVALRRVRSASEVVLARRVLDARELAAFLATAQSALNHLLEAVQDGTMHVQGEVPAAAGVAARAQAWLELFRGCELRVAAAAGLGA